LVPFVRYFLFFPGKNKKEIAMHFSHLNDGSGTKATKLAVVAGLHVAVAMVFIHSINYKHIAMPTIPEQVLVFIQPEIPKPPPPPPEPPTPMPKVAPPPIVVPKVEVDVTPPVEQQVQATTVADPAPAPAAQVQPEAAPAQPSANTGAMRSAVLADANGCVTPEYPVRAARNGESGTVTLALLVGADGRVASSRIQSTSGSRELDKAAVSALSMCKFKPAMNGGVAEAGWAQIAYVWKLQE
jgi:protein TonB